MSPLYFLYSQENLVNDPDTTFINTISFEVKNKRMTDVEIRNKRNNIEENYLILDKRTDIHLDFNPVLEKTIKKYYSYKWLPKVYGLLDYYNPLFENSLAHYKMPSELKYLAIIESNLNPQGGSKVGAAGLWQFMPATGKQYNLVKSRYINLFYDPYSSTDAACRYLNYLFSLFNDWNLVLSSYNCGQGCVSNAIKKAGTKDYFKVRAFLPKETRDYVMKFHTVKYLHYYYNLYYDYKYNIPLSFIDVKEKTTQKSTNFKAFCKKHKLDLKLTYFLNPHLTTEIIPKNCFVYYIN